MASQYYYAVGRRKTAVARVRLMEGEGNIIVNGRPLEEYFGGREYYRVHALEPLRAADLLGRFNAVIRVVGGGLTGQAGAIRHALARAIVRFDENLRSIMRKGGFLTRDARMKERKKFGLKRARKAPQYTKR
jgi:small subunit ribosomal protein S9